MRFYSWILFFLVVLAEGLYTTLPLVLIFLLCLAVMKRKEWIFFLAFITGIILDILTLRAVGFTSVLLLTFAFLVLLYEKKYEIATLPFVSFASFFASYFYVLLSGQSHAFLSALCSMFIAVIAYSLYRRVNRPEPAQGFQKV